MTLKITILGCGSSGGVPRIGNVWGACDPDEPKNVRRRCSLLVEKGDEKKTTIIVDTGPDFRMQMLDANVAWLNGVLYTHEHADHIHGIDDLRMVAINQREKVQVYLNADTLRFVKTRFSYCFETPTGSAYPPILSENLIVAFEKVEIEGEGGSIAVLPFDQVHGNIHSLGFRFGNIAYSSDVSDLPQETLQYLEDLDVWIIDALRYNPHPSHFNLDLALNWIDRIKPRHAVLTNMHVDLDYQTLCDELPDNVVPAYDGMVLTTTSELPRF